MVRFLFVCIFTAFCLDGFAQDIDTPIGTADLSNGGKITIMSGWEVTINNEYDKPDKGYRFIAFDIFIDNSDGNSDIKLDYIYKLFEIRDSNGYSYRTDYNDFDKIKPVLLNDTTLESGDILRGFLTFQILENVSLYDLRIRFRSEKIQSGWIDID
jgi:hypothetical protein